MSPIAYPTSHATTGGAASSSSSSTSVTAAQAAKDQDMFLQLLVAQLQNQDPTQPMDSSTFVTQLAQFQQLQSTVGMAQDVSSIRSDADTLAGVGKPSTTSSGTSGSGN